MSASRPTIEFLAEDPSWFAHPYPAAGALPAWLAGMPAAVNVPGMGARATMRGDAGMMAGTSAGYIIPLAYDCEFECDARGTVSFRSAGVPISPQKAPQYKGAWFEGMVIIKFWNPWVMRTPPGYCALVVPAINRFEIPFEPLSGVVETDTYYLEVFFPSLCLMRPGQRVVLRQGTPLVQVIPVPREPWRSIVGELDVSRPEEWSRG